MLSKPKSEPTRFRNILHSITHYRLPKTQIAIVDVIVAVLYVFVNLAWVFLWNSPSWTIPNSLGSIAMVNAFFLALPATRNSVIVWLVGIPFDKTIMFHRWLGRWMALLAGAHTLAYLIVWGQQGVNISQSLRTPGNICGIMALLTTVFIIVSSIGWIRRKKFNVFYWLHFSFIALYLFGAFHVPQFVPFSIAVAAFYLFDRVVRLFWGLVPRKTTLLQVKPGNIVQVRFPRHPLARYRAGQYVFVNFPGLGPFGEI